MKQFDKISKLRNQKNNQPMEIQAQWIQQQQENIISDGVFTAHALMVSRKAKEPCCLYLAVVSLEIVI